MIWSVWVAILLSPVEPRFYKHCMPYLEEVTLKSLPPPLDAALGAPLQGTPRYELRRRRWSAFSARVMKYWNKLPASVVTAPSVNIFKKMLESLDRNLSPSPPMTEHSPLQSHSPPVPPAHYPSTVIIFICYPTPRSL